MSAVKLKHSVFRPKSIAVQTFDILDRIE